MTGSRGSSAAGPGIGAPAVTAVRMSGQEIVDRFGTAPHVNGTNVFVKGECFEQFESAYYSPEDYTYSKFESPKEVKILPGLIEGIHLSNEEAQDPDRFWRMHEDEGTAESFQEIASHIPEVSRRLFDGATLEELEGDERLSKCASIYFRNKPEVIERDGYYEFTGNGRHRILAARALGYEIPVKVIGARRKK